ncbi:Orotate phosphoribosyltransferase [Veillonella atypica]|nr:Orotate phosphoribosyltransferase [Veillonella atypica]
MDSNRTRYTRTNRRRYRNYRRFRTRSVNVVNQSGGEIVGVGLLVNRSGGKAEFGVPKEKVQALLNLEVPTYKPEECPLCKEGVAMTERGSKHIKKIINKYKKSSFTEELFLLVCSYCV